MPPSASCLAQLTLEPQLIHRLQALVGPRLGHRRNQFPVVAQLSTHALPVLGPDQRLDLRGRSLVDRTLAGLPIADCAQA